MNLRMAQPWRDPKSGVWHLRQRTPQDLLRLKDEKVTLPVGDTFATVTIGSVVQVSLRTKDNRQAKERHAVADAALRRFWEAERNGPVKLSQKQAVALAGTFYRGYSLAFEENPGSPERWANQQDANERAREGRYGRGDLMIGAEARHKQSREDRWGKTADGLLAREGLKVDAESRTLLLRAIANAHDFAARKLERNAEGDYTPDPNASRFPEWTPVAAAKPQPKDRITVADLFDRWKADKADKIARGTIRRYTPVFTPWGPTSGGGTYGP
jgi:GH24 family phage-related lysozyme (muramidase)